MDAINLQYLWTNFAKVKKGRGASNIGADYLRDLSAIILHREETQKALDRYRHRVEAEESATLLALLA